MPKLINSYIFKEMAFPFLLSAAILTSTALLSKVIKLVELSLNHDIGISLILRLVISLTPPLLIYTIPGSFLIAVLVSCTRLSSDNEIVAMKASGIGLANIMKPVFLWAVIAYTFTLLLTLYLFPWGNHTQKEILFEAARTKTASGLEEKVFYEQFKDVVLYVDEIPSSENAAGRGELRAIFISQNTGDAANNIIVADSGVFIQNEEELSVRLKLFDGEIHRQKAGGGQYHIVKFFTYEVNLDLKQGASWTKQRSSSRELYVGELAERIKEARRSGMPVEELTIDLHKRFALPASVFVFALLGVPLGIQKVRSARLTGFSVAVGVFILYYTLTKSLEALGDNGFINPVLAAWAPVLLLGILGLVILYRTAREKPPALVPWIEGAVAGLRKRILGQ